MKYHQIDQAELDRFLDATERVDELLKCCIGSRAAFSKLLLDRESLSDDDLFQIIQRLDEVIAEGK